MTDIAAIIKVFMEPGLKADRPGRAALRPGTMLNGRITDILPSGLLQINFGKFRTQTRVRFPVAKGDTLRFEVLETGNRIKLKIQDPPPTANKAPSEQSFKPENLQQFRRQLETAFQMPGARGVDRSQADSLRPLTARLSQLLVSLQTGRAPDQLAPLIKALLTNSGIFFEKKLETVLLQLFKSPESIEVNRAAAHPFVTNIFDSDLKPNLLKLAAALEQTGRNKDSKLAPLRTATRNFIKHIEIAQAQIIRSVPAGSGKTAAAYTRTNAAPNSSPGGRTGPHAAGLPAAAIKALQRHLVKTGLRSDPQIRALLTDLLPAPAQMDRPLASQRPIDTITANKGALQQALAGMIKNVPAPGSKVLAPVLADYRGYIQANQLRLDTQTEKALFGLEAFYRRPTSHAGPTGPGLRRPVVSARQNLQILARFINSPPPQNLSRASSAPQRVPGKMSRSAERAPVETKNVPRDSGRLAQTNGRDRTASRTTGREITRIVNLIEPKAMALSTDLDRIEKTVVASTANSKDAPAGKKLSKAAQSLQALIERNQIPTGETVNRALTSLASSGQLSGAAALRPGALSEKWLTDLAILRDFITFQKAELNETLDLLRGLQGRADADPDTGDRPSPDRGRGTDPLQVIAFTLPVEEGQQPARLKVFYPLKKNAATGSGFRISLLLSMERMGPIRADIFAYQQNLEVKFNTATEAAQRFIDDHLSRLDDLLKGSFETINLSAAVDEKNIAAFEYEDLELAGDRLVDLQA